MKSDPATLQLYVATEGNDRWSGRRPTPNRRQTDGPFATVERARQAVCDLKRHGALPAPVTVWLRDGRYELRVPVRFAPRDSGSPGREVTYAACPGEHPILSGGRRIGGWRETMLHGQRAWVASARGSFTQLWVNGRRATRPRVPREGCFRIEKLWESAPALFTGQDRFRFARGDLREWRNLRDIEFVGLHYWIESRIPLAAIDVRRREVRLQWRSRMRLADDFHQVGAQYYVENVFEALTEPGQWYLDRSGGQLWYLPLPRERIAAAEVVAPRLPQLLHVAGEHLHFEGLGFQHSEWTPGREAATATPQAACHIPGALVFRRARQCSVRRCAFEHLGSYGIEIADGSSEIEVVGNRIADLAGGGVKIWHSFPGKSRASAASRWADMTVSQSCRRIMVTDNEIGDGGHRWRQAVGVLIGKCGGIQVLHNHIHDFDYTGISVGWTWGYAEGHAYGNIIEHNHIHDIGRGVLSDMGAIYTLGVQPGTRIRYNRIHDVESRGYGGWGIYTDEGSSHILIENNLVYRTKSGGFHQHYGRENIVRNNIFALAREGQFQRTRIEPHDSFRLTGNIFYADNGGKMAGGNWADLRAVVDGNLYHDARSRSLDFAGKSLRQWQRLGADRHSVVADPRFRDPSGGDFRLRAGSPARRIGFVSFDLNDGPRKRFFGRLATSRHADGRKQ